MTPDYAAPTIPPGAGPLYRRLLHLCALAVAISVFPLIWMGGLVTTYGAGLSVPDWPNSYGYNMFLFPPSQWLGGIFYEHTHRLLGTLSGFLSITLALMAWGPARTPLRRQFIGLFAIAMWATFILTIGANLLLNRVGQQRTLHLSNVDVLFASLAMIGTIARFCIARDDRRWVRWLTIGQLLVVIIQGLLGGLRVTELSIELAMVHACFAQLFFSLAAFTALTLSTWWRNAADQSQVREASSGRWAGRIAIACFGIIFCQLIAGALMRHNLAGLAIPDLPLAFGKLLPPTNEAGLEAANQMRIESYHIGPTTLTRVWLHFAHRCGAVLVTMGILTYGVFVLMKVRQSRAVVVTAAILLTLVTVQITLGVLTVYWQKPADIASGHVAVGALTLMASGVAIAVTARLYAHRKPMSTSAAAAVEGYPKAHLATA